MLWRLGDYIPPFEWLIWNVQGLWSETCKEHFRSQCSLSMYALRSVMYTFNEKHLKFILMGQLQQMTGSLSKHNSTYFSSIEIMVIKVPLLPHYSMGRSCCKFILVHKSHAPAFLPTRGRMNWSDFLRWFYSLRGMVSTSFLSHQPSSCKYFIKLWVQSMRLYMKSDGGDA